MPLLVSALRIRQSTLQGQDGSLPVSGNRLQGQEVLTIRYCTDLGAFLEDNYLRYLAEYEQQFQCPWCGLTEVTALYRNSGSRALSRDLDFCREA